MNNALKFGLIGVAVWWLLKDNIAFATSEAKSETPQGAGGSETSTDQQQQSQQPEQQAEQQQAPAPVVRPRVPVSLLPDIIDTATGKRGRDDMLKLAATDPSVVNLLSVDPTQTSDQWNYWRKMATGVETTVDLFTPGNRLELISASEYWARRQAKGLGQLVRSRMGRWS